MTPIKDQQQVIPESQHLLQVERFPIFHGYRKTGSCFVNVRYGLHIALGVIGFIELWGTGVSTGQSSSLLHTVQIPVVVQVFDIEFPVTD